MVFFALRKDQQQIAKGEFCNVVQTHCKQQQWVSLQAPTSVFLYRRVLRLLSWWCRQDLSADVVLIGAM